MIIRTPAKTSIVSRLNAGQLALVGSSFVSFVRAFDTIFELTVFRRHSMDNLVGTSGGAGQSAWRPVIDHLACLKGIFGHDCFSPRKRDLHLIAMATGADGWQAFRNENRF
jgi:hypothetical protein